MPQRQDSTVTDADHSGGYHYYDASSSCSDDYLLSPVLQILREFDFGTGRKRIVDLGCGNGFVASVLTKHGYDVVGIDPSEEGIHIALQAYPHIEFHVGSAYDDLVTRYGQFDALVSLEVVEHVFWPRRFAASVFSLLKPGGMAIISTPYHGYWKNLVMALFGKMDNHYSPLWDYGHIKFWSMRTLSTLLEESGLSIVRFIRVGRIPILAKSMIAVTRRL